MWFIMNLLRLFQSFRPRNHVSVIKQTIFIGRFHVHFCSLQFLDGSNMTSIIQKLILIFARYIRCIKKTPGIKILLWFGQIILRSFKMRIKRLEKRIRLIWFRFYRVFMIKEQTHWWYFYLPLSKFSWSYAILFPDDSLWRF